MLGERRARWHCGILPSILVPGGSRFVWYSGMPGRPTLPPVRSNVPGGEASDAVAALIVALDLMIKRTKDRWIKVGDGPRSQQFVEGFLRGASIGSFPGGSTAFLAYRFGVKTGLEVQQKNQVDYPWATWPDRDFVDADLPAVPGGAQSRVSRPTHFWWKSKSWTPITDNHIRPVLAFAKNLKYHGLNTLIVCMHMNLCGLANTSAPIFHVGKANRYKVLSAFGRCWLDGMPRSQHAWMQERGTAWLEEIKIHKLERKQMPRGAKGAAKHCVQ